MKHKKLKITVAVIVGVFVFLFAAYKVAFNTLAPIVFDYIVGKNPEALLKLDEPADKSVEVNSSTENGEKEDETESEEEDVEKTSGRKEDKANKDKIKKEEKEKEKMYSTETYIGTLTSADLARVIKAISPADKTRIISICKSVVAPSDMPRFAKMAKQGMSGDDMAYAESYLRAALSAAQKREIMEIVRKYL